MSLQAYGEIYQIGTQHVSLCTNVTFNRNGPLLNISHITGTAPIAVELDGIYNLSFTINTQSNTSVGFSVLVNGVTKANFVSGGQNLTGLISLSLNAGDIITISNTATKPDPAVLRAGTSVSASVLINKING